MLVCSYFWIGLLFDLCQEHDVEYTAVIRGVLVVNLKELHHEFFIAITNCNIGCFQHPNHFLLVVDSEALIGEIIFGCLTDCLVDVVSSLSLFHF